jgi:hypothetical protein
MDGWAWEADGTIDDASSVSFVGRMPAEPSLAATIALELVRMGGAPRGVDPGLLWGGNVHEEAAPQLSLAL